MTITLLSDQDTGFENKARVRKLPLQVFTAPDAQILIVDDNAINL